MKYVTEDALLQVFEEAVADIQLDLGLTNVPDRYPTLDEALAALSRRSICLRIESVLVVALAQPSVVYSRYALQRS